MVDYSCDEIVIANPIDIINNFKESCPFIENYDNTQLDNINTSFNEQLQIVNLNKYILNRKDSSSTQIKQSLYAIIESLRRMQEIYSQAQKIFNQLTPSSLNSPSSDFQHKIDELLKQYGNELSNLEKYIYKLNIAYKTIGIKQIREITLQVSKSDISSIFDKINKFFAEINEYIKNGNSAPEMNQTIFETNILFVQMHEILFHMDDELVDKLPDKMKTFIFNYTSLSEYEFEYDISQALPDQLISDDTKSLIAYFDYNYWADEDAKNVIELNWNPSVKKAEDTKEGINENTISSELENNAESSKTDITDTNDNTEYVETHLIVKKPNIFIRILNKIKSLFSKHETEQN